MRNILIAIVLLSIPSCEFSPNQAPANLDPKVYFERDMVVQVNGVTRQGSITMPLLPVNNIHVYSPVDLDEFRMETCGGVFKKQKSWNIEKEVPSGLFGWGSKKITLKNQVAFTISATDFHHTGVCAINLIGISKTDGHHSEAYINWQTPEYKLGGYLVCNMEKRPFSGVEACSTKSGSYVKVSFDEQVSLSPTDNCIFSPDKKGQTFEWRTFSGRCSYEFKSVSGKRGMFHVYGYDEEIIR